MMKYIFMIIFMIPLINSWWLLTFFIFMMLMYYLMEPISLFFNCLSYGYGFDLVSYWLILLSIWITGLMMMASYKIKMTHTNSEFMFVLVMMFLFLLMCFSCSNLFLYYLWFESSMIPILFLIYGWGYQPERMVAGMYLIFYTLFASFPLLLCIFYIYSNTGSLFMFNMSSNMNFYIYISLLLAFLVKMPMFFTHFWLPKAHVEAPVSGSMILAGVLLKLGGYGLYRVLVLMKDYFYYNVVFIVISLIGSVVVGLLCLCQVDMKSMIAYSSVSHMGLVIGGLMAYNYLGFWGSLVMMLGHGLCSSGLFALANIIYERSYSRSIMLNKGLMIIMPTMSMFSFLLLINNMSSPPSLNLLGELFLMMSLMSWSSYTLPFLAFSSFICCGYSVYLYSILNHGRLYDGVKYYFYGVVREYLLLLNHWVPLNVLFLKGNIIFMWL
uniref:NADH dehydrogenase subunit 4 n=1 Tax=Pylorgus porrectus TaxID=3051108 RepID=UPI0025A9A854|nr:NADH dehydrogenase subunit 4 [Pylorgus porrectus]WIF28481.1 NADH dehydrogenase subunit 4 [Pylorgus porrectus]